MPPTIPTNGSRSAREHFGITRETMKRSIEREIAGSSHFDGEIDLPGLQQAIDLPSKAIERTAGGRYRRFAVSGHGRHRILKLQSVMPE